MGQWQKYETEQSKTIGKDQIAEWSNGIHRKIEWPNTDAKQKLLDVSKFDAILLRVHISWILRAHDAAKPPADDNWINPQVWPLEDHKTKPLVLTVCSEPIGTGPKLGFAGRAQLGGNFFRPSRRLAPGVQSDYSPNEIFPDQIDPTLGDNPAYETNNLAWGGLFADVYAHARSRPELVYDFGGLASENPEPRVIGLPPIGELHFVFNFLDGKPFICNYSHELYVFTASKGGPP